MIQVTFRIAIIELRRHLSQIGIADILAACPTSESSEGCSAVHQNVFHDLPRSVRDSPSRKPSIASRLLKSRLPGSLAFSSTAIGYSDCPMNNRTGVAVSIVPGVGGHIERNSKTIPRFVERCRPERVCFRELRPERLSSCCRRPGKARNELLIQLQSALICLLRKLLSSGAAVCCSAANSYNLAHGLNDTDSCDSTGIGRARSANSRRFSLVGTDE